MDDVLTVYIDRVLEILADENIENRRQAVDAAFLKYCLEKAGGNRTAASNFAGIGLRTLTNQIAHHPEIDTPIKEGFERNVKPINEEAYRILNPSPKARAEMIKDIGLAKEVYHIRGFFNMFRPLFNYPDVLEAAYQKLKKFQEEPCELSRTAAEDLQEDIEIYEENPRLHKHVYIKKRSSESSDSDSEVENNSDNFHPSACHPSEPEWADGKCHFCYTNRLLLL